MMVIRALDEWFERRGCSTPQALPQAASTLESGEGKARARGLNTTTTASFGVRFAPFVPFIPPASIAFAVAEE